MTEIRLEGVAHSYLDVPQGDADWALKELDQTWEDGSASALLGPSGCGKTTLLNVISGLIAPTRGQVRFDREDVTERRTEQRNIAQVFQFPVIYDTMTVYDNLAFPLRNRQFDSATVDRRVGEVAEMLDLSGDLRRRANRLSADSKQKISLGRGLVRPDVTAILFDEPLTVIDPHLKWHLRRKLKEIHERFKLTLIYVTHDQNEALTFADQVMVMHEGRVLQVGTPQDLFEAPAHRFVGFFIGSPGMNFLPCVLDGGTAVVDDQRFALSEEALRKADGKTGRLEVGIRPEFIRLTADGEAGIEVRVVGIEDLGSFKIVTGRIGGHEIKVKIPEGQDVACEVCNVAFKKTMTRLYADGVMVA